MPDIPSLVIYVGIIQFVLGMAWQSGHREQTSCYTGAAEGVYDHFSSRTSPPWDISTLVTTKLPNYSQP